MNRRLIAFLISFLIATIFWLLISLTKFYTSTVSAKLVYANHAHSKAIADNIPGSLSVEINAKGFDLLAYYLHIKNIYIDVDIEAYLARMSPAERKKGVLQTDLFSAKINQQLSPDARIIRISPQNFFLNSNNKTVKKVPVRPNFSVEFDKQYGFADSIRLTPDSAVISGSESILNSIDELQTEPKTFSNVNKTINTFVGISLRKRGDITLSEKRVKVVIPVEKYTESSLNIPVEIRNLGKHTKVKIIPSKISVSFRISLSNYKKVKPEMFNAVVDFSEADQKAGAKLSVDLEKYPPFINTIKINPGKVDCLIQK